MQPEIQLPFSIIDGKPKKLSVACKRFMQHNAGNLLASFPLVVLEEVQHNSTLFSNKTNLRLFKLHVTLNECNAML